MRKALLLFTFCLPVFADSVITTQLTGTFVNSTAGNPACSGATSCQASFYEQFRDPNVPIALYTQQGNINATAGYWFTNSALSIPIEDIVQPITVPAGSYLLTANLNTFDGSQVGNNVPYLSPLVRANATFNIPVDSGDVQMKAFVWSFSTERYGSGDLTITTSGGNYHYFAPDCARSTNGPCAAGPGYSPEFDFTIPHTYGTEESITFQAYSGTTFQETNNDSFEAIITPTPEPTTFAFVGSALALLCLLVGKVMAR